MPAPTLDSLRSMREVIVTTAEARGVHHLRVFGSVARGTSTSASDVDLLVEFEPGRSLFDLGGAIADLEDLFGCPVDVVTVDELRPVVRERILAEAVEL